MKIPLKNTRLEINLVINKKPKLEKLKRELSDYFEKEEIEGRRIKEFDLEGDNIIPQDPYFEESLSGGEYDSKLKEIGKKYNLPNLGFVYFCYHK